MGKRKKEPKKKSINLGSEADQWMSDLPESLWAVPLSNLSLPGDALPSGCPGVCVQTPSPHVDAPASLDAPSDARRCLTVLGGGEVSIVVCVPSGYSRAEEGSHDAMTYCLDKESEVSANGSKLLQLLDKHMHCIVHPIILRWSITQDLTVLEQLDAGIRYFDFRIAHKSDDPSMKLYFVHMLYTTVEVEVVLWDILRWLKNHPWEVVVLAFRNFDGLDENHHNHLVSCIKKIFSSRLCPRNIVPTLWNMWSSGYQVILSYDKIEQLIKHSELWPAIPYWWGNKDTAQKLIEFLAKRKQSGRPDGLFVAGINLTADLGYILTNIKSSVKKMTQKALPFLNMWIKKQQPGSKKDCINIIAGDFIENNNFVENVINLNRKLILQ